MYDRISPGKVWLDTDGKRIQAHGGSILAHDGKYYWYGENKEFTTGNQACWHNGIRMYESTDLYNWKDLGIIIPANTWTQITLQAEDIEPNGRFLILQGNWAGTIYIDDFAPLN